VAAAVVVAEAKAAEVVMVAVVTAEAAARVVAVVVAKAAEAGRAPLAVRQVAAGRTRHQEASRDLDDCRLTSRRSQPPLAVSVPLSRPTVSGRRWLSFFR